MVHTSLYGKLYEGGHLFHPGYERHGADPDLTERAKELNEYVYAVEALLVEVDYEKNLGRGEDLHRPDLEFYIKRREEGFTWEI